MVENKAEHLRYASNTLSSVNVDPSMFPITESQNAVKTPRKKSPILWGDEGRNHEFVSCKGKEKKKEITRSYGDMTGNSWHQPGAQSDPER